VLLFKVSEGVFAFCSVMPLMRLRREKSGEKPDLRLYPGSWRCMVRNTNIRRGREDIGGAAGSGWWKVTLSFKVSDVVLMETRKVNTVEVMRCLLQ
jgi:hypothetical protein